LGLSFFDAIVLKEGEILDIDKGKGFNLLNEGVASNIGRKWGGKKVQGNQVSKGGRAAI